MKQANGQSNPPPPCLSGDTSAAGPALAALITLHCTAWRSSRWARDRSGQCSIL